MVMPSYRLLRSNKESGPYSLSDLVKLGLKPYDLVWVDGRSAAWRYPSEVSELKEYAPAVEEQPYDRFFKKPSETEASSKNISRQEEIIPQKKSINENFVKEETVHNILKESNVESNNNKNITPEISNPSYPVNQPQPKKIVFVSMPETIGFEPHTNPYEEVKYEQKYEQYLPKQTPIQAQQKSLPAEEKPYSPINIQESHETKLETKYTQSLDDIKDMYINTLVQRKTRNRRKEIFKKYVRPALAPVCLLIAGVAIGYIITSRKTSLQASQSVATVIPQQNTPVQKKDSVPVIDKDVVHPDNKILQPDKNLIPETNDTKERSLNKQEQASIEQQKVKRNIEIAPKALLPGVTDKKEKESFIPDNKITTIQKKNVEVDPTTGERKKVTRDNNNDVTAVENYPKNNTERPAKKNSSDPVFLENDDHKDIRDLVSVKSNEYLRGAFGGIRGLELTVYNNSNFLLDEVSVELQIMKPSEQPLRTDIITFRNIAANGKITVKVPDSQRGIRVDYRITNIESKQWQKNTAGL
jgi:hypothetical protein